MKEHLNIWLLGFVGCAIAISGLCGCDGSDDGANQSTYVESADAIGSADIGYGEEWDDEEWDEPGYGGEDAYGYTEDSVGFAGEGEGYDDGNPNVKAGVYDDNVAFDSFLSYLDKYAGLSNILPINISERYVVTIMATQSQRPLPGATLVINANDAPLFVGTTNATGGVLFHPRAHGAAEEAEVFDYTVTVDGGVVAFGQFDRLPGGADVTIDADVVYEVPDTIRVDIALVLDTTGSMGDEIKKLKDTYKKVAEQINAIAPNLDVRFGMVLYRDKGDDYVTKVVPFTGDVQSFVADLKQASADGGGDTPEDLQEALDEALHALKWRANADIRVLFTLADAEPQLYAGQTTYPELLQEMVAEGIHLHAIAASGSSEAAEYVSRQMAQFCFGYFLFLTYGNDVPGKPGSGTGSGGEDGYTVHQYLSGTLDELMVKLVTQDVYAILGLPIPGTEPEPEPEPEPSPNDCSQAQDFQCGFMAVCEDGVLKAEWHVHEFTEGQEVEDIVEHSCQFACPASCKEGEIMDWPLDGEELVAGYCL